MYVCMYVYSYVKYLLFSYSLAVMGITNYIVAMLPMPEKVAKL